MMRGNGGFPSGEFSGIEDYWPKIAKREARRAAGLPEHVVRHVVAVEDARLDDDGALDSKHGEHMPVIVHGRR